MGRPALYFLPRLIYWAGLFICYRESIPVSGAASTKNGPPSFRMTARRQVRRDLRCALAAQSETLDQ
jgi:hypothetical protein